MARLQEKMLQKFFEMNRYDSYKLSRALAALAAGCVVWLSATARETALDRYVAKPDPAYEYRLVSTLEGKGVTTHILEMTSQQFLTEADVDRTTWKHWLTIARPHRLKHDTSLMLIGGGRNGGEAPDEVDDITSSIAVKTGSVVTELGMIPNQPLRFAGDDRDRAGFAAVMILIHDQATVPSW